MKSAISLGCRFWQDNIIDRLTCSLTDIWLFYHFSNHCHLDITSAHSVKTIYMNILSFGHQ